MPDINCDLCESELSLLMVTVIANGDTLAIGAACIPAWAREVARAMGAGEDPGEILADEHSDPMAAAVAAPQPPDGEEAPPPADSPSGASNGAVGAEGPPRPKRGRKTSDDTEGEPEGVEQTAPAPVD